MGVQLLREEILLDHKGKLLRKPQQSGKPQMFKARKVKHIEPHGK